MRLRRARVVSIESVTEIENTGIAMDEPTPERVVAARRELERVQRLIEELPDRCRRIFELRKVDGLSQREVAEQLGVTEFVIGNEVAKGMKLILQSIADGDRKTAQAMARLGYDERTRNRSEEHTSELQSLMRISYAVFCLKKKNNRRTVAQTAYLI